MTPAAGRPSIYSDELALQICERLADGESLRSVCATEGFPNERTVRRWALDDKHPFSPQYTRARELGYHKMADEMLEIADDGTNDYVTRENKDGSTYEALDSEHVQRSRLRVDTRKWLLGKALPKLYGDKVELTGKDGKDLIPEESMTTLEMARQLAYMLREGAKAAREQNEGGSPPATDNPGEGA